LYNAKPNVGHVLKQNFVFKTAFKQFCLEKKTMMKINDDKESINSMSMFNIYVLCTVSGQNLCCAWSMKIYIYTIYIFFFIENCIWKSGSGNNNFMHSFPLR